MDEFRLGEGEVRHEFIGGRLVVQQLCDSHVTRGDRRDNTRVDLGVQPLSVDVVRFTDAVVVHIGYDGVEVTVHNNIIVVPTDEAKVCAPLNHRQCWCR